MAQRVVDQTINPEELEKAEKAAKKRDAELAKQAAQEAESGNEEEATSTTSKKKKVRGSKYKKAKKGINTDEAYELAEAIKAAKKAKYSNFEETLELHINLGIDPKNSDQRIRFTTTLPNGTGKSVKVLVISEDNSGEKDGVLMRDESVIEEIIDGSLQPGAHFDAVICTPAKMKDLAKAARILGPKGMMPSPKTGTVTDSVDTAIESLSKGQIEIKNQSGHAVIHQSVGKLSFKDSDLEENITFLIDGLNNNTPGKLKKRFIQSAYISSTMGPSVRIVV